MGDLLQSNVFDRTQSEGVLVSDGVYNGVIGLVLGWGLWINWLIVKHVEPAWIVSVPPLVFFIAYFASCLLGIFLFNRSSNPIISFIGYNLVVVPFGFVLNLVVSRYEPTLVLEAVQVTALVTAVMMALGSFFPAFFQSIARSLWMALLAVILIELVMAFIFHRVYGWIDWAVVLIFCGYIGVDWGRANRIPKTIDNAIDSAAAIYMDIINLFLRILRILARRRR